MLTKFTKAGSSVAVIIPASYLKSLSIKSSLYKDYSFDMRINEDTKAITLSGFTLDTAGNDKSKDIDSDKLLDDALGITEKSN